jgi:hypothetical protein
MSFSFSALSAAIWAARLPSSAMAFARRRATGGEGVGVLLGETECPEPLLLAAPRRERRPRSARRESEAGRCFSRGLKSRGARAKCRRTGDPLPSPPPPPPPHPAPSPFATLPPMPQPSRPPKRPSTPCRPPGQAQGLRVQPPHPAPAPTPTPTPTPAPQRHRPETSRQQRRRRKRVRLRRWTRPRPQNQARLPHRGRRSRRTGRLERPLLSLPTPSLRLRLRLLLLLLLRPRQLQRRRRSQVPPWHQRPQGQKATMHRSRRRVGS